MSHPERCVRDCLAQAAPSLQRHLAVPPELARRELRSLLAHVLDVDTSWLYAHDDESLPQAALGRFDALVARRLQGEPVAYLTGQREFFGHLFWVGPAVLVPRPETELLVELTLARLAPAARVLDLGTGSGCIAISLALARPDCQVHACDRSETALVIARDNAARLGAHPVFAHSDWLSAYAGQRFDLLVSNPPYVAPGDPHLPALAHEPASALVAADAGFADLAHLIATAPQALQPGGWLLLEHGATQGDACRAALAAAGFEHVETCADFAGLPRVSLGALCQAPAAPAGLRDGD
jgi:release factor glutamine methyltransferase